MDITSDITNKHIVEKKILNGIVYYFDRNFSIWDSNFNIVGSYKNNKNYFFKDIKSKIKNTKIFSLE